MILETNANKPTNIQPIACKK